MNRPPRKTGQHVMDGFAVWRVAFVGSMIAIAAFILEARLAPRGHSPEFIRTVLLQMLVTAQWVYMINCRSSDSFSLSMGLLRNKGIWLVTGVLLLMQLVIIYVPLMQSMFGTEALPLRYWFVTLVIGVAMFLGGGSREASDAPVPQNGLNNLARLAAGARYCRKDPL